MFLRYYNELIEQEKRNVILVARGTAITHIYGFRERHSPEPYRPDQNKPPGRREQDTLLRGQFYVWSDTTCLSLSSV